MAEKENSKKKKKPTYKLSASLIGSYLYHMATHRDYSREGLLNSLKGIYVENKWTKRGNKFEREVSGGQHPYISDLLDPLEKQVWGKKYFLETKDFKLQISGKADAYDKKNKIIYDTKRVDRYFEGKYSEDNTIQHLFYFLLFPEAKKFVYLVAYGKGDKVDGYTEVVEHRPKTEKELLDKILKVVVDFISYLNYKGLWSTYTEYQKANTYRKYSNHA